MKATADHCRRGHPRNAGNSYRDGTCKLCRQITRRMLRQGLVDMTQPKGTRGRPEIRPEVQPEALLEQAIARESWTPMPPWERPGWQPTPEPWTPLRKRGRLRL